MAVGQAWALHAATGGPAVVTFGAGRMQTVAAQLLRSSQAARLVFVPDRGKETQAREIAKKLDCGWCELPPKKPANYDVNDYLLDHGVDALARRPVPTRIHRLTWVTSSQRQSDCRT
jgi:putative DNA primase/helicase